MKELEKGPTELMWFAEPYEEQKFEPSSTPSAPRDHQPKSTYIVSHVQQRMDLLGMKWWRFT